jgi:opacity protein-like surface antigen
MKIIYLLLLLLFFISTSQAQLIRGYGVKIGATLSKENWDYKDWEIDFKPDSRWGLNVGIFGEFLNIPYFSVVTEFNYVQKGMTAEILVRTVPNPDVTGEYFNYDSRIDYLNLSALGKLRFDFALFTPYILIGPKVDFEINNVNSFGEANEVEEKFIEIMYGIKVGGGAEIKLSDFRLLAEIIYDYNFNDLYENEHLIVTASSVDFRIGIMF